MIDHFTRNEALRLAVDLHVADGGVRLLPGVDAAATFAAAETAVLTTAKGFETADTLSWTVDNADAVSLVVSDDTKTCTVVAGNPGSAVITVTDGTLSATEAIDVITADTTAIVLGEGAVTTQP